MALQQTERHPIASTTPTFTGYWALLNINIDTLERRCGVRLGLYYSLADYLAAPKGNILRPSETFVIDGADYDAIFPPDGTPPEEMPSLATILYMVFLNIKLRVDDEGNPGYFADAEIVP